MVDVVPPDEAEVVEVPVRAPGHDTGGVDPTTASSGGPRQRHQMLKNNKSR